MRLTGIEPSSSGFGCQGSTYWAFFLRGNAVVKKNFTGCLYQQHSGAALQMSNIHRYTNKCGLYVARDLDPGRWERTEARCSACSSRWGPGVDGIAQPWQVRPRKTRETCRWARSYQLTCKYRKHLSAKGTRESPIHFLVFLPSALCSCFSPIISFSLSGMNSVYLRVDPCRNHSACSS